MVSAVDPLLYDCIYSARDGTDRILGDILKETYHTSNSLFGVCKTGLKSIVTKWHNSLRHIVGVFVSNPVQGRAPDKLTKAVLFSIGIGQNGAFLTIFSRLFQVGAKGVRNLAPKNL